MAVALAIAGQARGQHAERDACRLRNLPDADVAMRVPFDLVDGRIYVQARADGQGPFRFAVDTGASGMARADTTRFDTLQLGTLARSGAEAIARDYRSRSSPEGAFDGILAREFFADGLLIVDYPSRTLTFSRTQSLSVGDSNALAYRRAFRVPVSIGVLQAEDNVDTGANVAFVVPRSLYDQLGAGPLQPAGRGRLTNSEIETWRATVHGPFRIAGIELSDVDVRVSERCPELLVGAHALQRSILMIDQRSKLGALCR